MRRRGRDAGLGALFVEREQELAAISEAYAAAQEGAGRTIIIEGPAGTGKSRLLTVAGDMAREAGMQVLGAAASELEREFPLGVAVQLFEPRWGAADADERRVLLDGPAGSAEALLERGLFEAAPWPGDQGYPLIHGLFWLASNLASIGPLVMLVDDAHWSDPPSLRFLSYLAGRLGELPVVLIVTVRQGEPATDPQALAALASSAPALALRLGPLSDAGIESIVRAELPDAEPAFIGACARVTRGNPLLLTELLAQLQADGCAPSAETAEHLTDLTPEAIVNFVVGRLRRMPAAARSLAGAVSLLGDGTSVRHAARLAGIEEDEAAQAADGLATVHLLRPGASLSFVHPLIRSAVAASMSPLARGHAHRRAAAILSADGCPPEMVGAHLLQAPAGDDPQAVETLRAAARNALASGSATSAARLLRRALAERPAPDVRVEILAELGQAEALDGLPQATDRLTEAIQLSGSPRRRAELALTQSRALYARELHGEAAGVWDGTLAGLGIDEPLAAELEAAYVSAASLVPSLAGDAWARRDRVLGRVIDRPTPTQRAAVAHIAVAASLRGEPRAGVRKLVDLAWGQGTLLRQETADGLSWPLLNAALLFADELERDLEICDAALISAHDRKSPLAVATVSYCRAWPLYEQGRILAASGCAQAALDARPDDSSSHVRTAYGAVACCHIQLAQFEQAERALATIDDPEVSATVRYPFLLDVRAQLRLAQHRPEEALQDAQRAGEILQSAFDADNPGAVAWRSTAALAQLGLGEPHRARELAAEELARARRIGVTRVVIRDLRVLGLAEAGRAGIELLTEAVRTGAGYPTRLDSILALVDLGAALRRANQRAAAREPLRQALGLSQRGGAAAIAQRARTELAATGARPRREQLSGILSLTASERRVADLAAESLTTRQMAESLFITPKTVEFHLRNIYRKLDIRSRGELADVIDAESIP